MDEHLGRKILPTCAQLFFRSELGEPNQAFAPQAFAVSLGRSLGAAPGFSVGGAKGLGHAGRVTLVLGGGASGEDGMDGRMAGFSCFFVGVFLHGPIVL